MTTLFIGGPADAQEIEVQPGFEVWRVAYPIERSLAVTPAPIEPRKAAVYTKRIFRKGSWLIASCFAEESLTDRQAFDRYVECMR